MLDIESVGSKGLKDGDCDNISWSVDHQMLAPLNISW